MSEAPKVLWTALKPNRAARRQMTVTTNPYLAGGLQALVERVGVPRSRLFDDAVALLLEHYRPVLEAEDRIGAHRAMAALRVVHPKPPRPKP